MQFVAHAQLIRRKNIHDAGSSSFPPYRCWELIKNALAIFNFNKATGRSIGKFNRAISYPASSSMQCLETANASNQQAVQCFGNHYGRGNTQESLVL